MDKKKKAERQRTFEAVLKYNAKVFENLSADNYPYSKKYLNGGTLRTLLDVYSFLSSKRVAIYQRKYFFFLDGLSLAHKVKGTNTKRYAVQQMNLLCCLGVFEKSTPDGVFVFGQMYRNTEQKGKREINTYIMRKATKTQLRKIETRAKTLFGAGVTVSNVSSNKLRKEGLTVIAGEVYPKNSTTALDKKYKEFERMKEIIDFQIRSNGYATRESILHDLKVSKPEMQRLLWIFKQELNALYNYRMPTKQQMLDFNLQTKSYIYTAK